VNGVTVSSAGRDPRDYYEHSVAIGLAPNTGNLVSANEVDQIWWWLDEVPVDGFLGGEGGAAGLAYDARVVSAATTFVEPFEQLSGCFA